MVMTSFSVKKGVIYPITISDNKVLTPEKIVITPPYDDEGVSFKGYSKRLIKNNEYKIFPQVKTVEFISFDSVVGSKWTSQAKSKNYPFYCSKICIFLPNGTANTLFIQIGNLGVDGVSINDNRYQCILTPNILQIEADFSVPLLFSDSSIHFSVLNNAVDTINFVFYGWYDLI